MEQLMQTQAIYMASLAGAIAFALSGFLVGARHKLDWMGLLVLSFLTANGGGMLRDILSDRPLAILHSSEPFLIAIGVTIAGGVLKLHQKDAIENRWLFVLCEAIGLVAFAITGCLIALEIKAPFFGGITLAFLTAAGGAILRDVLMNSIPEVLHGGFYGSIAILVACAIYILNLWQMVSHVTLFMTFMAGVILRILAYHYRWSLPKL